MPINGSVMAKTPIIINGMSFWAVTYPLSIFSHGKQNEIIANMAAMMSHKVWIR